MTYKLKYKNALIGVLPLLAMLPFLYLLYCLGIDGIPDRNELKLFFGIYIILILPAIPIYLNHLYDSFNKTIIINNTKSLITIKSDNIEFQLRPIDILKIELIEVPNWRITAMWNHFKYFQFSLRDGSTLYISSLIVNQKPFLKWRIASNSQFYPLIPATQIDKNIKTAANNV